MGRNRMAWCLPALGLALVAPGGIAWGQGILGHGHDGCGGKVPCPPPFIWYSEGPPRIKFKHACPRPVCNPCQVEHAGYFQTCWTPWPFPPDWSHCPTPPPVVLPPPAVSPYALRRGGARSDLAPEPTVGPELPTPRKTGKDQDRPAVRLTR